MNIPEDLIDKYFSGKASEKEVLQLFNWIEESELNKKYFLELKRAIALNPLDSISANNVDKDFRIVKNKIGNYKRKQRRSVIYKYAAVLVVGLCCGTFFYLKSFTNIPEDNNSIVLELSDGTKKVISADASEVITGVNGNLIGTQQNDKITYVVSDKIGESTEGTGDQGELVYNTLYVPKGKRFYLQLSDGTNIHLNSGTTLKFPVRFIKGLPREVFMDGEAYFDVVKNPQKQFVVNANNLSTVVYGTSFNINSYKGETSETVVLVSGSLGVKRKQNDNAGEILLKPNEKVDLDINSNKISKSAAEVQDHIAWLDGRIVFKNKPLKTVFNTLERHYNVIIDNKYKAIEDEKFTGEVGHDELLKDVIKAFSVHSKFTYRISEDKIIINP